METRGGREEEERGHQHQRAQRVPMRPHRRPHQLALRPNRARHRPCLAFSSSARYTPNATRRLHTTNPNKGETMRLISWAALIHRDGTTRTSQL